MDHSTHSDNNIGSGFDNGTDPDPTQIGRSSRRASPAPVSSLGRGSTCLRLTIRRSRRRTTTLSSPLLEVIGELKYMSKLKFHEKKLLKKVNFVEYKREGGHREALVTRRYHLSERDDYKKYSSICRMISYNMGVISTTKILTKCDKLSVSSFCRCRLATV
ncbi:hypothetical protein OPV22_010521 [Ensete ventricosum]|uniref:Small ribosomal subunit protein uS4 N-terminal domain-containing protein n=1 Tax=Ensete ventricosum TaxID=4639 RepID=A0AAV8RDA1_ENSVE|nr:hypothetical protein OPV22_010521 [Ensete ventricosum]